MESLESSTPRDRKFRPCVLALEDGTVYFGEAFGAEGTRAGEVVFNTAMTGYQEVLTDPSYYGQIVSMTYPLIGNYGVNEDDVESEKPRVAGFVVREFTGRPSNHRATLPLDEYLARHDVIAITGVDTRALTRKIRLEGAMRGVLTTECSDPGECVELARRAPGMTGADLVKMVAPNDVIEWSLGVDERFVQPRRASAPQRMNTASVASTAISRDAAANVRDRLVIAIDCGMKRNIARHLVDLGCRVRAVPPTFSAEQILEDRPAGVFVSNGPGDPAAVTYTIETLRKLIAQVPIFGICLGHQLLGLALGASTFKLKFGHRAANHPVRNVATGRVEITSQNHGFAVETASLERAGAVVTHVNLNDGTLEGFVHRDAPILAVQYHPEASPGPHDATYLFDVFARMMETRRPPTAGDMDSAQRALQQRMSGG